VHVLIVEPFHPGHRLNIAGLLLDAVLRLGGVRVTFATTPDAAASTQFETWVRPRLTPAVTIDTSIPNRFRQDVKSDYFNAWLAATERVIKSSAVDHVILPAGDGVVAMTALRKFRSPRAYRQAEWETMLFRGRFAYVPPATLKEKLSTWLGLAALRTSPMRVIHHMDPLIGEAILRRYPQMNGTLDIVPDPVDPIEAELTKVEARRKLGLREDGRIVGCAGSIDTRKGLDLLIFAFLRGLREGKLRADDRLLLVGKHDSLLPKSDEITEATRTGHIVSIDRFVSDEEMSNGLSAMDLVATPYPSHIGSASIAIRAAAQRRPVLANTFGWLGAIVPRFHLGTTCDVTDADIFAASLVRAMDESAEYVQDDVARQFVRYCSVENFQSHWVQRLATRLGVTPPAVIRWGDLVESPSAGERPVKKDLSSRS
jgi:glycosyltransferase involved in cell wall biosynthesis